MKQYWNRKTRAGLALFVAVVWMVAAQSPAQTTSVQKSGSAAKAKSRTATKRGAHKISSRTSQRTSAHRASKRRPSSKSKRAISSQRRRAQIRPEPERIEEIQRALVQTRYLNEEPNGRWDDATRDAMRRYQTDHGFPATGLPEARSLMKLGLGPHPLPESLDASHAARASADTPRGDPPVAAPRQDSPPPGSQP